VTTLLKSPKACSEPTEPSPMNKLHMIDSVLILCQPIYRHGHQPSTAHRHGG